MAGFLCPLDNSKVNFDFCTHHCLARCMELPILLSLMGSRDVVPGVYSVTEILKPPRIVNYNRQVNHYSSPFDLMFMQFGTAFHSIIEKQGRTITRLNPSPGNVGFLQMAGANRTRDVYTYESDNRFETKIAVGGREITLTGVPDQYEWTQHVLTDYKTSGYYAIKLLMEGKWESGDYRTQVNLYRRYRFPDCKRMQLVMLVKDYSRKLKHEGVPPLVTINVPFIQDAELDTEVKVRLFDILEGESNWMDSRDCTDDERWTHWKTKERVRCEDYCMVKSECPQYQGELCTLKK